MNELVFLEPNYIKAVPFTTSEVIAEYAKVSHHAVQQMISKNENDLKEFGLVAFEMRANDTVRGIREEKIYHLNEEQATLLITYLKNTEPVRKFKKDLVKAFYLMREELFKRGAYREILKPTRRTLTDEIQANPEHNAWDYKLFTDLAYKVVTGKIAVTLRKERGAAKNAKAIDFMTANEISQIEITMNKITVLYGCGFNYYQIKAALLDKQVIGKIA